MILYNKYDKKKKGCHRHVATLCMLLGLVLQTTKAELSWNPVGSPLFTIPVKPRQPFESPQMISVAVSGDGSTVAFAGLPIRDKDQSYNDEGDPEYDNVVRMFRKNNRDEWMSLGEVAEKRLYDDTRYTSVALSEDGNTLAVGTLFKGASVYQRKGETWNKIMCENDGCESYFGIVVDLSSIGDLLLAGTPWSFDGHCARVCAREGRGGIRAGAMMAIPVVDKFSGTGYEPECRCSDGGRDNYDSDQVICAELLCKNCTRENRNECDESVRLNAGYVVSLSDNGDIAATASFQINSLGNRTDPPDVRGLLQIYQRDASSWTRIGRIIDTDFFGASLSLSKNGESIAIGAPNYWPFDDEWLIEGDGKVYVYAKTDSTEWKPIGQPLIHAGQATFGWHVGLSGDGTTLVAADYKSLWTYKLKDLEWYIVAQEITRGPNLSKSTLFSSPCPMALSTDGTVLAVVTTTDNCQGADNCVLGLVYKLEGESVPSGAKYLCWEFFFLVLVVSVSMIVTVF